MLDFEFSNPARIVFGRGAEARTGRLAAAQGKRVLLVYGGGSIVKSGLYDRVTASLKEAGLEWKELPGVRPNPRLDLVRAGAELCRREKLDSVLAVGGGSVIDTAKSVAVAAVAPDDIWSYFLDLEKPLPGSLPVGVVLTIPATGSETSDSAVITNSDGANKRHIAGECLTPRYAVLNPELTFTLPAYQTACGASDILSHLMERYFSETPGVGFTDRLLEGAMLSVMESAPAVLRAPRDYDARAQLMWAGTVAHNNLLGTGRLGDWASHSIEHELSGIYDIAHGAGLAIVTPAWMKYVGARRPAKFAQFAERVLGIDPGAAAPENTVMAAAAALETWYRGLGLPVRLGEAGIDASRLREMAEKCLQGRTQVGNLLPLHAPEVEAIYRLAL